MDARVLVNHDEKLVQMCIINNAGDVTTIPAGSNRELVIKPAEELTAYADELEAQGYNVQEIRTFVEDYNAGAYALQAGSGKGK